MYNPYPMYQQPMQYQQPQQQVQQQNYQQNQQMQIQNGGFVPIRDENMVYSYPVEYGKCVTFKVEGKPIVIEKSMGFSQFEAPKIERYRLVKEEVKEEKHDEQESENPWQSDFENLYGRLEALEKDVQIIKTKTRPAVSKKKEDAKDDTE